MFGDIQWSVQIADHRLGLSVALFQILRLVVSRKVVTNVMKKQSQFGVGKQIQVRQSDLL